jgi:fluoroquinolone transport system permease protein
MRERTALRALLRADVASARREPLLLALVLATPLLILLLRFGYPLAETLVRARWGLDLEPHRPFALGALLVVDLPMNAGAIIALLVLDERDDGTLTAMGVTPLGLGGYVRYRLLSGVVLAALLPAVSLPLTGLVPLAALLGAVPALLPALLIGPLAGCVVLVLAQNKVDGLAMMKGAALVWALPLAGWFVDGWWTPLLRVIPTGAVLHALWGGLEGEAVWLPALAGAGWTALLLALLWPAVRRRLV